MFQSQRIKCGQQRNQVLVFFCVWLCACIFAVCMRCIILAVCVCVCETFQLLLSFVPHNTLMECCNSYPTRRNLPNVIKSPWEENSRDCNAIFLWPWLNGELVVMSPSGPISQNSKMKCSKWCFMDICGWLGWTLPIQAATLKPLVVLYPGLHTSLPCVVFGLCHADDIT